MLNGFNRLSELFVYSQALLSYYPSCLALELEEEGGGGGILPGRPAPGTVGAVNPMLDQGITLVDWFVHPNNNMFDGMTIMSVPVNFNNYNPAATMTILVSLEPMAPLVFLGPVRRCPSRTYASPHIPLSLSSSSWHSVSL